MAQTGEESIPGISRLLSQYLQASGTPGAALAVLKGSSVPFTAAEGTASIADGSPMTTATLFGAGSITKTVTALTFTLLEREGLLRLSDPVAKYLPRVDEEPCYVDEPPPGLHSPLTISHLLSHASGIPELGYTVSLLFRLCGVSDQGPFDPQDPEGLFSRLVETARLRYRRPGAALLYSNENYVLLARIAERVTGRPFPEIVAQKILAPLGMQSSAIGMSPLTRAQARIAGHIPSASGMTPIPLEIPPSAYGPGGLVTNIDDMARYLTFLLGRGRLAGEEPGFYTRRLWQKVIARQATPGLFSGLGWFIQENEFDEPLIFHSGDLLFSGGFTALLPQRGLGVVIGQNAGGSPALADLARAVLGLLLAEEAPRNAAEPRGTAGILSQAEITGVYTNQDCVYTIEAFFEHGFLKLRPHIPGGAMPVIPFGALSASPERAEFLPTAYPPSPRRSNCVFFRPPGRSDIWLQYENSLFVRRAPE